MTRLTDKQLILLSRAAQREDGAATLPDGLKGAAATKAVATLIARKLMREVRAKPNVPTWRRDQDGREYSLLITRAGRDAIGLDHDETPEAPSVAASDDGSQSRKPRARAEGATAAGRPKTGAGGAGSAGVRADNLA